jgi:glutamate-5-semialdehyde dehydrogenase
MLSLDQYIDVLIPRGGEKLQRMCQRESSIPVIIGGFGISHIFVDESADLERSVDIIFNAKTQKPSACNSLDTLLVHEKIADKFLPMVLNKLKEKEVVVLAHDDAFAKCGNYPFLEKGIAEDFDREFLSLKMNVRIVPDVYEAITHLRVHNASHSDSILTDSRRNAELFVKSAGSACVYVNASTRFSDGGQFGMGAEVAISTQKLHARGPMALQELTTYQYVCSGDYIYRH